MLGLRIWYFCQLFDEARFGSVQPMHNILADHLQKQEHFCHRHNLNGTFDSICMRCFATAARANVEEALARLEYEHICDPIVVERFIAVSRE